MPNHWIERPAAPKEILIAEAASFRKHNRFLLAVGLVCVLGVFWIPFEVLSIFRPVRLREDVERLLIASGIPKEKSELEFRKQELFARGRGCRFTYGRRIQIPDKHALYLILGRIRYLSAESRASVSFMIPSPDVREVRIQSPDGMEVINLTLALARESVIERTETNGK